MTFTWTLGRLMTPFWLAIFQGCLKTRSTTQTHIAITLSFQFRRLAVRCSFTTRTVHIHNVFMRSTVSYSSRKLTLKQKKEIKLKMASVEGPRTRRTKGTSRETQIVLNPRRIFFSYEPSDSLKRHTPNGDHCR